MLEAMWHSTACAWGTEQSCGGHFQYKYFVVFFCFSEKLRFPNIQTNTTLVFTVIAAYATRINVVKIKPVDLMP